MKSPLTAQRGSAVLVALCLTVVLGIAVIGYVAVCARTMKMSNRSFCTTSSVQLAEIGMEEALWHLNQSSTNSPYDWLAAGWTKTGNTVNRSLNGFTTNLGVPGTVNIQIDNINTISPTITSNGILQMTDGMPINKQLMAIAKPAALFPNAVGAYSSTSFTINWTCPLDSYETHVNLDPASALQTRTDEAIVGAPTVSVNAANISGYVATAGTAPTYTTGGTVTRADTPGGVTRDPRYIFTNANQTLFDILADANLPGTYAGAVPSGTATLSPTVLSRYTATDLSLTGSTRLTIDGPVIIVVSGNFYIGDTAKILITANGSAQIIVGGSTYIGGGGVDNGTKLPKNLAVMSRSAGSYSWSPDGYYTAKFETSTPFYGVIYVPNGSLSVYGNTTIYGALAANVVDQHYGNGVIHYDLDLRQAVFKTLNTPYEISQWLVSN